MVVQGMWDRDHPLMQVPHFTKEMVAECKQVDVNGVLDIPEMEVGLLEGTRLADFVPTNTPDFGLTEFTQILEVCALLAGKSEPPKL